MKDENVNGVQAPVSNNQAVVPPVAPAVPEQPAPVPVPQPVQEAVPTAPVAPAPVPVQQPVPTPAPVIPTPAPVVPTPVVEQPVAPAPVVPAPVAEVPAAPVAPAPVQATTISNEGGFGTAMTTPSAPAPEMTSVPAAQEAAPLPALDYNQSLTATPVTANTTIAPSVPLGDQVAFISTGQEVKEKKSKKGLVAIIVLLVLGGLGALAWFVIVPMVKQALTTPKQVFDTTITTLTKEITNNIEIYTHDKATYTLDLEIDSNIDTVKDFAGYTYTAKLGIDPTSKLMETGLTIVDAYDTKYSMFNYAKGGKAYERYSTNENLLYVGEDLTDWDAFNKDALTPEEATYLVEKFSTLFKESLDEKYLTKNDDASVTVKGETVKASKYTYKLVDENIINTARYFAKGILEDDKLFDIFIKMQTESLVDPTEEDIEELRETFEDDLEMMIEEEPTTQPLDGGSIEISIYTESKSYEFAGIEVIANGDGESYKVQYSTLNGNYNVFIYTKSAWNGETEENTIRIDGIKNGNVTNVTVKVEDVEYATFKVTDGGNGDKSIDYEILLENIEDFDGYANITGNLTYTNKVDEKKQVDTISFEIKSGKTYFKMDGKLTTDWTSDVANINTGTSISPSEYELETIRNNFLTEFESKTPYGTLIGLFETDDEYIDEEPYYIDNVYGDTTY